MQTVRTTVAISPDTYELLRQESFASRLSFGQVIERWLTQAKGKSRVGNTQVETLRAREFFESIAEKIQPFDPVQAIRQERDRNE